MEGQDWKVGLFHSIEDSAVLNGLTSLRDRMDTMDKKMDTNHDSITKTLQSLNSLMHKINNSVDDLAKDLGNINRSLGHLNESQLRKSIESKFGKSFSKSWTAYTVGDITQLIARGVVNDPQRDHFKTKKKLQRQAILNLKAELGKVAEDMTINESKRQDARYLLSSLEQDDPEDQIESLLAVILLTDMSMYNKYKSKGLNGLGLQFDHRGSIMKENLNFQVSCGESKLKNYEGDEVKIASGGPKQVRFRLKIIEKVIKLCYLSDVPNAMKPEITLKGYVFTNGELGYTRSLDDNTAPQVYYMDLN
eukprot:NODE_151_length_17042_cov_0.275925.p3 type:complete len:306 gc:universal NODE_151_length_17042_cov_0.275925:15564-16481(+)